MIVLIDFGNSYCKWVQIVDGYWQHVHSFAYDRTDQLNNCLQHLPLTEAEQIHIVSVLGAAFDEQLSQAINKPEAVHFHQSQTAAHGILLGYRQPASYGVDRYATLVAAHQHFAGHKIIVDCGTAITVDVLQQDGQHLGGIILPGVDTMCASLAMRTSGLAHTEPSADINLFADNSADAIHSGAVLTASYGLQGVIKDIQRHLGRATLIFTGGGRHKILGFDRPGTLSRPHLVLEGLFIMAGGESAQVPTASDDI